MQPEHWLAISIFCLITELVLITTLMRYYFVQDYELEVFLEGSKKYDVNNYNCVHQSQALINKLTEMGYETEMVCGGNNSTNSTGHAWVKLTVYIDATSGEILKPNAYAEKYPIQGKCVTEKSYVKIIDNSTKGETSNV